MSGLLPENKDVPHYLRLCGFGPVLGFWFCFKNLTCHWRNRANKSRPYFSPGKRNFGKIAGFVFRSSLQYIYLEQKFKAEEGVFSILALVLKNWSGKRDSNPRPSPWQGDALPLSYSRKTEEKEDDLEGIREDDSNCPERILELTVGNQVSEGKVSEERQSPVRIPSWGSSRSRTRHRCWVAGLFSAHAVPGPG